MNPGMIRLSKTSFENTSRFTWEVLKNKSNTGNGCGHFHTNKSLYTRKLAAVMFTDIVGYTDMIDRNEDKTLAILAQNRHLHKHVIDLHQGLWIKEMGDGILSSFNTPANAVNCALDILKAIQKINDLKLHIGIHFSKVVFFNRDIYGIGVNIASRIQELANPGKILVTESVFVDKRLNKAGNFRFVGKQKLKSVKHPIGVYELAPVPHTEGEATGTLRAPF